MTNKVPTLNIDIHAWFPLPDGRWLRLSRENHGGPDRVHLRVCEPRPDPSAAPNWTSPAGPVRPTPIGLSLERQTWRALMASLKEACATAMVDDAGVPLVTRHVQRRRADGLSLREISAIVGMSKSQVHRLLAE